MFDKIREYFNPVIGRNLSAEPPRQVSDLMEKSTTAYFALVDALKTLPKTERIHILTLVDDFVEAEANVAAHRVVRTR